MSGNKAPESSSIPTIDSILVRLRVFSKGLPKELGEMPEYAKELFASMQPAEEQNLKSIKNTYFQLLVVSPQEAVNFLGDLSRQADDYEARINGQVEDFQSKTKEVKDRYNKVIGDIQEVANNFKGNVESLREIHLAYLNDITNMFQEILEGKKSFADVELREARYKADVEAILAKPL